ncbi:hypothetical protein [Glycomyces harbinensis]|uniref:hypothetical protein n=1 Tax=Glycomyces harbinensis TaxID=58114 RepID=UPI000B80F7EA|nr:hypothetical protein [Glycomyces harbinensis]
MADEYPQDQPWVEHTKTGLEAGANVIPLVGGIVALALSKALNHKLEQRRAAWLQALADEIARLSETVDGLSPENLAENDDFIDAVVTATRIIDRTSQQEKIRLLKNAVMNSARTGAPQSDVQQLFFRMVDDLTVTHLNLLMLFGDPPGWFDARPELERPDFSMSSNLSGPCPTWQPRARTSRTGSSTSSSTTACSADSSAGT